MRAAYAVSILLLVLLPLGVLAPTIDKDEMDLTDYHPRNFNMPQINDHTYANPRDPQGRPGLVVLLGDSGDLVYDSNVTDPIGPVSPGENITVFGRVGGWDTTYTLAEVDIYIFWNTNITTGAVDYNSPPYNGLTTEDGSPHVAVTKTNGTAMQPIDNYGGIPEQWDLYGTVTGEGYFNVTFPVPSLGSTVYNVVQGNNTIVAYFCGLGKQNYHWKAGETIIVVQGNAELSGTPFDQNVDPGDSIDFTYQVTKAGQGTSVENASVEFNWTNTKPNNVTISAPGFIPDGTNTWRTNSSGYVTFRVNTSTETPFGSYDLYANITSLTHYTGEDNLTISLVNHDHNVTLTIENLFDDAIVEVTAQPVTIPAGYSTIVKVVTKFPNGTVIGDVPVNITISASSDATWQDFANISLIDEGNPEVKPGWNETNSTGEISWNFTSYYDEFGNYTPEGNVWVDAVADYGHWDYGQGTAKYRKFYFINGTNNQDWNNQFDNSTGSALFSINNQWSFGHIEVGSIDQGDKIGADGWRQFRADTYQRDNITLVLVVYNNTISNRLENVPVTFWLNFTNGAGSGVSLSYWFGGAWILATVSGETVDTDGNGEIKIAINVTAAAPKYMYVVLNATANFTDFSRFQYLNGSRDIGTRRYSDLPTKTTSEKDRGFQVNPRYSYGEFDTDVLRTDNDTYALDHPDILQNDGIIRRGNWVNMKFQVLNNSEPLANATVNFTLANPTNGVSLTVNTGLYPAASTKYSGFPDGWYLTDSSGYIELNITTSKVSSPKRKANVNVTADVSFSVFPYINATSDHTKQNETKNSTFTLDPQYVFGSVTSSNPIPKKVPSGGSNITITFTARDSTNNHVPDLHLQNWSIAGITNEIFALYSVEQGAFVNHTFYNFTIYTDAVHNGDWKVKSDGTVSFTIDPTNISTPEGDYYLMVTGNFSTDGFVYLNGTSDSPGSPYELLGLNAANGTSPSFKIKEENTISVTVTGTYGSLGQEDGLYLVRRGVTQIDISGSYFSSTGNPRPGPVSIGWNSSKRISQTSDIWGPTDITVASDGTFSATITITLASGMPINNITIFADNTTVPNLEFEPLNDEAEAITYAFIRIVSQIRFDTVPSTDRPTVYVGQTCTISGSLIDEDDNELNQTLSADNALIRGWGSTGFIAGTATNGALTNGDFSKTFSIPNDYSEDTITVVVNITKTCHYLANSDQSLILNIYSDVDHESSQGAKDGELTYQNSSQYDTQDPTYNPDSGIVAQDGTVEIYNGSVIISGYLYDQADRPLNDPDANEVAVLRVIDSTWLNTTTDSNGRFQVTFSNMMAPYVNLNGSWTIMVYFITENGTVIWLQNFTIAYYALDFAVPTHVTEMEQGGVNVDEGTFVYGEVVLYINATDPGPVTSGITDSALSYIIDTGPLTQADKYNATTWFITIDTNATAYDGPESHTVYINITDNHNNILQYSWVFMVDNTAPTIQSTSHNDGDVLVLIDQVEFTLEDPITTGRVGLNTTTVLYRIDSDLPQDGTSYFNDPTLTLTIDTTGLSGQNHTIQVWISDLASNQGTLVFNFTIDFIAPTIDNWGSQVNGSKVYVGTYVINITITDPAPTSSNISTVIAYVDNPSNNLTNPFYNSITGYYETTWSTSGYDAGIHTITVIAYDYQGNQNSSSLRLDLVKITSPEAEGTPPYLNWTSRLGPGTGNIVNIRVEDPDENGTIQLLVISYDDEDNELDSITLSLSETSSGTGIFIGELSFSLQESSQGIIKVTNNGNVRITYAILMNDSRLFIAKWYGGTTGTISFDEESYDEGDTAVITLVDGDRNLDPTLEDEISVTISIGSSSQTVTLTETKVNSGEFTGQVTVGDGDTITVTYSDTTDQNGSGPTDRQDTAEILGKAKEGDDTLSQILLLGIFNILALGGGVTAAFAIERYRHRLG